MLVGDVGVEFVVTSEQEGLKLSFVSGERVASSLVQHAKLLKIMFK